LLAAGYDANLPDANDVGDGPIRHTFRQLRAHMHGQLKWNTLEWLEDCQNDGAPRFYNSQLLDQAIEAMLERVTDRFILAKTTGPLINDLVARDFRRFFQ